MKELMLVRPLCKEKSKTERLSYILERGLAGQEYREICTVDEFEAADLAGKRLLFAIALGESGINLEYYGMLKKIRLDAQCLEGCIAGMIVDGNSELFTKAIARDLMFSANAAGCAFIGRPLVEGTKTLKNFNLIAKLMETDQLEAYAVSAEKLVAQIVSFEFPKKETPGVLMLHASNEAKSNTIMLWKKVREHLTGCSIREISLREGEIKDCRGCPYTTCLHFGEQDSCFYGGLITEQIFPAILKCDVLVLACPNYNDAVGANIAAFINRLTALCIKHKFYDKALFALVVSGYSGGDLVAEQLLSALSMNKSFSLPARFCLTQTANDPGEVLKIENIEVATKAFAQNMLKQIKI